jgi:16S rRNA (cytosine1402-N4)-methyltransferase
MAHIPVLLKPTLEYLNAAAGERFIDCTAGGGGHIRAVLEINPAARVLGLDWDQASLDKLAQAFAQEGLGPKVTLVPGNYREMEKIAKAQEFAPADGILLDLGFSSLQLDDPARGFSFQADGPLDMRYSAGQNKTAQQIVNRYSALELARVFKDYGEEKFARRLATGIVKFRTAESIATTGQLASAIISSLPGSVRFKATETLRRIFQALRLEVNQELDNLQTGLPQAMRLLKPGGRLVVISFHSLEDRIVKEFFAHEAKGCVCPPEFPTCVCGKASTARILTRKPITADDAELAANSRAASAKLRALEKI